MPIRVALRTEGVDRNVTSGLWVWPVIRSPSVRRAWIEITSLSKNGLLAVVALRTEGVDRNHLAGVSGKNIIVALRIEGLGRNLILIV